MNAVAHRSIWDRMRGAAMLDTATYEEVEHDGSATGQAALVVAMTAAAQAIGAWNGGPTALVGAALGALVGWGVWAGVTYLIGDKLFGGTATWGELLRTLGFAQSPNVLAVLGILPLVGWLVDAVLFFWILVAGVVAIRQALDFGTGRAILTAVVGALVLGIFQVVF
ncbi:MAG: YIP1 family protein [Gemmatimonadetes bacterium]|nr:YIP1 family protein [Gemmatimonadota bacterium]